MMQPLQLTRLPFAQQASTVGLQAGTLPAVGAAQFDMTQMMDMIMMIMFLVIMVKMMGGVTKGLEASY